MKSTFKSDLEKEKKLSILLDKYYSKYLKNYHFERIHDSAQQFQGIDVIFKQETSNKIFHIDEKAQLDYINESLPTFAFELLYLKNKSLRQGWLFDASKTTDFYALVTSIYEDEPAVFTSCQITFVNRNKLIDVLKEKGITQSSISKNYKYDSLPHGKIIFEGLNPRTEGYLYHSKNNKAEKPINLILRLNYLLERGIAKNLL